MTTPEWLIKENIIITLDARPLLAQGIHPLEQVQGHCASMQPGEVFEIITPFHPAPMIEKIGATGFETYSASGGEGLVHSYFCKK